MTSKDKDPKTNPFDKKGTVNELEAKKEVAKELFATALVDKDVPLEVSEAALDTIDKETEIELGNAAALIDNLAQQSNANVPFVSSNPLAPENLEPDLASHIKGQEDVANLLVGVNAGMQNSTNMLPALATRVSGNAVKPVDGMARPGYYSINKSRVAGQLASQVGGRFYFPLDAKAEVLKVMKQLVKDKIFIKVSD